MKKFISLIFLSIFCFQLLSFAQPKLQYNHKKALDYAKMWCFEGNDCSSKQYRDANNTDCTHFISHILKAGGVIVPGIQEAQCNSGLCIRVKDLAIWFSNATTKYSNVKKIENWKQAKMGDFCFQKTVFAGISFSKHHSVLLADIPKPNGANIFGHQSNRCGEFVEFNVEDCVYYRIFPEIDGIWESAEERKRWKLEIYDGNVIWTERNELGQTYIHKTIADTTNETFRIERPNTNEVLQFLGFSDQMRQKIIARSPKPSYMIIKFKDGKLTSEWFGILATKDNKGNFKELKQPGEAGKKDFVFSRIN